MNKIPFGRYSTSFILCLASMLLLIACNGSDSTSVATNQQAQQQVSASATTAVEEPTLTPIPTQPLPNITVQELYSTDEEISAGSNPYPAVNDDSGLPAPVLVQEDLAEPAASETDITDGYPAVADEVPVTEEIVAELDTEPATKVGTAPPQLPQTSPEDHYWMVRPIEEGGVVWTDKFYPYGSTRNGTLRPHHGVEFNVGAYDVPVLATAGGTVVFAGADDQEMLGPQLDFYGNTVVIEHDFAYEGQAVYSLYAHLNGVTVVEGQTVNAKDVVGLSGASGIADAVHLHFEVRVGANNYESTRNPLLWLWPFPDDGTIVGRVTYPDGTFAEDYPVSIHRIDAGEYPVISTKTYASNSVNGDDRWPENFAFDDVDAGRYEVYAKIGNKKYVVEVQLDSRRTAYAEIVIGE